MKYLKKVETDIEIVQQDYNVVYKSEESGKIMLCPSIKPYDICVTYNISDISQPTTLFATFGSQSYLTQMSVDDNRYTSTANTFQFDSTGEHIVKYKIDNSVKITVPLFYNNNIITDVKLTEAVNEIGMNMFNGCSGLTSINIPDSVTSIGTAAFLNCPSLTVITIPDSVTNLSPGFMGNCPNMEYVKIGSGITSILSGHLNAGTPNITKVDLSEGLQTISTSAFQGLTKLENITIPDSVTSIGNSGFTNCSGLTEVTIGSGVTSIGSNAFSGCTNIETLYYNATLPPRQNEWSGKSNLKTVVLGDNVTSIGSTAFAGCSGLTSVTIPDSVTSIGNNAFGGCVALTSICCDSINEPCTVNSGTFALSSNKGGILHVAKGGSAETYPTWMSNQGNLGWSSNGVWTVVDDL